MKQDVLKQGTTYGYHGYWVVSGWRGAALEAFSLLSPTGEWMADFDSAESAMAHVRQRLMRETAERLLDADALD